MTPSSVRPSCRAFALLGLFARLSVPATATAAEPAVAHADIAQGHAIAAAQCGICHSFAAGGPSLIGPDLYGVVGRPIASVQGYAYSTALSAKKGTWTLAALDAWLAAPSTWAPGTKMGYAGLDDAAHRADVIAYLQSLGTKIPFK